MKRTFYRAAAIAALWILPAAPARLAADLPDGLYAELKTPRGAILLELQFQKVPLTVANFVGLAEGTLAFQNRPAGRPFYDGLTFHRVIADFMIQGGDPSGDGSGGPGYRFPDEIVPELRHDGPGVLSMANSGPDSNGSQFFITHKATPWLDRFHTVFGRVVQGQEVVKAIRQGDRIERIRILRRGRAAEAFRVNPQSFQRLLAEAPERRKQAWARARAEDLASIQRRWPDALTTASGLRYKVLRPGRGPKPKAGASVTVHYIGSMLDGRIFDSSVQRGQPASFRIGEVIPGWNEALLAMKKGEKRLLIIPPELAYGERGYPGVVPPNAFLVFEVELLGF
jgi:cyclophilin family peptidyl-prolyl cis-trans isomerase